METTPTKSMKINKEDKTIELRIYGKITKSGKDEIDTFMDSTQWDETKIERCEDGSTRYIWTYLQDDYGSWANSTYHKKSPNEAMREDFELLQMVIS